MNQVLADLARLLDLERLELNLFRGESRDIGSPQVFGGQVLGQALMAAYRTVDDERNVHSLHAYFLRRGDFNAPIVYEVDRSRDGASFTSRRVVAIQHGQQIFHMSASFQVAEGGPDYQVPAPQVVPPEELPDLGTSLRMHLDRMPEQGRRYWSLERPFEFRSVEEIPEGKPQPGVRHIWFRLIGQCPADDPVLQRCLLAYVSDHRPACDGDAAARALALRRQCTAGQHRSRDVVSSGRTARRLAPVCARQPEQFRRARACVRSYLRSGWPARRKHRAGRLDARTHPVRSADRSTASQARTGPCHPAA